MATTFFSGVNARLSSAPIAVVSSTDLVVPLGSEVKTSMAEFVSWKVRKPRKGAKVYAAGSPSDAQGNIYPRQLRGGIVDPVIDVEGVYNGDSTGGASSDARFTIGQFNVMNLLFHVTGLWGYYNFVAVVSDFQPGSKISADPAAFTATLEVDGSLPAPSTS